MLRSAVYTESIRKISNTNCLCIISILKTYSINQIGCFNTPTIWNFIFSYLNLLRHYLFFDFLPGFTYIRSLKEKLSFKSSLFCLKKKQKKK